MGLHGSTSGPNGIRHRPFLPTRATLEWSRRVSGDEGLGWYVAREKIPKEGIDEQPYLRPSAEIAQEWLQSHDFSDYFEREFR